jgi:hypothetical protein
VFPAGVGTLCPTHQRLAIAQAASIGKELKWYYCLAIGFLEVCWVAHAKIPRRAVSL